MLNEFAKDVFPTPLSRWLAVGTASIAAICVLPPEWLQKLVPAAKVLEPPEIRLPLLLGVLALGTFFVLVAVLFHVKDLNAVLAKKSGTPTVDVKKRMEPEREKVLVAFIKNEQLFESDLEQLIGLHKDRAIYHLRDLSATRMAHEHYDGEPFWVIEQEGRRYLVSHGLLP